MNDAKANGEAMRKSWRDIASKYRLRCLWGQIVGNRTINVEMMWAPLTATNLVVVQHYDGPIPKTGSNRPWPNLNGLYVYAPIGGATWESLDKAIADLPKTTE